MFKDIKKKAGEKANEVKEATTGVGNKITNQAKNIGNSASELASGAAKNVSDVASSAGSMAKGAVDSIVITLATKIAVRSMKSVGRKGTSFIYDDKKYSKFVDRTWEVMPLPVRLIGKEALGYNSVMFTLRKVVFGKDKEVPKVDKQDEGVIKNAIKGMFQ